MNDESKTREELAPIWIKNEHGVVSCKPKWLGQKLVSKNLNWSYTEEPVKEKEGLGGGEKEWGTGGGGFKPEEENELSFRELQAAVKEMGVNPFGKKKEALKEILAGGSEFKKESIKLTDES